MIAIYFGSPGAGKTTTACKDILNYNKKGLYTFANFGCKCACEDRVSLDGIGTWTFPEHSFIAIDESGVEYNSRAWKTFKHAAIKWYKEHRHHIGDDGVIALYSQGWDDCDKTLRTLADRMFHIKKIGPFTLKRRIYKDFDIDKVSQQPIDAYKKVSMIFLFLKPLYHVFRLLGLGFLFRLFFPRIVDIELIFRPLYYKYFDTHERDELPCPFDMDMLNDARFRLSRFNCFPRKQFIVLTSRLRLKLHEVALFCASKIARLKIWCQSK